MYKSRILILAAVVCASIFFSGCDTGLSGTASENQPPTTNLTVERINRGDDFRLSSQINITWWGNDPDGYVVGYEYAINDTSEGAWTFTERSDSTFILPITEGQETDDVLFKVRAVDDDGERDPVGARLVYPIVNSRPTASFNANETPPDTLFSISSFGWRVFDPDGLANIRSTEIAINDTVNGWVDIPLSEQNEGRLFISLEVDNSTTGTKTADVFIGRGYSTAVDESGNPIEISGIEVGASNTAYVRSIDAAGAVSQVDTLTWYVKQQTSRTLFINDFGGAASLEVQNEHLSYLESNNISPDIWLINTGEVAQDKIALSDKFPTVIDPTLKKTLAKWDHIYWISDNIDRNITYALDITTDFFELGGSMFVNIPMKSIGQDDEIFNFVPVDSIGDYSTASSRSSNFIVNGNTEITSPTGGPELMLESTKTSIYPLKPSAGATILYQTDFQTTTFTGEVVDYTEFEGVGIENPEGNVIYLGMDLTTLGGNNNLAEFINYVCIQRLGFSN
jgi:hypothetical protein